MKRCSKCGRELSEDAFNKNKSAKDGLTCWCKECVREQSKKHYEINKCKYAEQHSQYREKNKDKIAEYKKQWYKTNKAKVLERTKQYYQTEKGKEVKKQWNKSNKEEKVEYNKQYRKTPSGKAVAKALNHKWRTQKAENGGSFSADEWLAVCAEFDNKCAYCGKEGKLTADHIIPVSKGGASYISNIIPVCKSCNSSKNNSKLEDWYPRQPFFMPERFEKIMEHSK